jgi:hypothetical protein
MTYTTREAWLQEAASRLRSRFNGLDAQPVEKVEAIVSWPNGSNTAIGQCFPGSHWTEDGTTYVTVSPVLGDDPTRVLDVLLHEMVHACGILGHGKDFRKVATAVGLTGKMTATIATDELRAELEVLAEELGPYPHVIMSPRGGEPKKTKKKGNQRKLVSPIDPDYIVYMLPGKLEKYGPPVCPMCDEPLVDAN